MHMEWLQRSFALSILLFGVIFVAGLLGAHLDLESVLSVEETCPNCVRVTQGEGYRSLG